MTYEKRNVILLKAGWDSYALPLNDMNLSLIRSMIEDAVCIDYDHVRDHGYVHYPKSKNEISFEIKSIQWADSKPEKPTEDE